MAHDVQVGMDRKVVFSVPFEAVCDKALTACQVNATGITVSAQHGKVIAYSLEVTPHSRCPAWIVTERVENTTALSVPPLRAAAGKV